MSKKVNTNAIAPEEKVLTTETAAQGLPSAADVLKNWFETVEGISLRKLSLATDVSYQMLLKASRKPIEGIPYDPAAINYQALASVLERHEIDVNAIDVAQLEGVAIRAALREHDLKQGDKYMMRGNTQEWTIALLTATSICLQSNDDLRTMSISTFLHQTPRKVTDTPTDTATTETEVDE